MSKKGTYYNFLKNVPLSELKTLRVAVKRNNITTSAPPGPLEREIDDPRNIIPCVHYRKGFESSYGIFDREGILINQEKRSVLADANIIEEEQRSSSHSGSRKRSRSQSPNRNKDRNPIRKSSRERRDRSFSREKISSRDLHRRSRTRSNERNKRIAKDHVGDYRRRSHSPTHSRERIKSPRPSHSDIIRRSKSRERDSGKIRGYLRKSRSRSKDRTNFIRKSISPENRRRSRSPRRRTPSVETVRNRVHGDYKTRSSRSPGYTERKRFLERHRSRSKSRSRIEREKRRSRSPRRRSPHRSPRRSEKESISTERRRSSRSPRPSSSRSTSTYRRSPASERDRRYRKPRSRSRSPHKSSASMVDFPIPYYEGIPGAEYWIPNPVRPRMPIPGMPRFFPPQAFYPRDMTAAYFMQPRFPPGYIPYRQRLPVYNSGSLRTIQSQVTITEQASTSEKSAGSENNGDSAQEKDNEIINKDSKSKDPDKDACDRSENN